MASSYFPLRWEGTGDQWWYASPIDWAAANGHYDLVRELLHLDSNLLIKLTSLRRILRLETLWDDEAQFNHVAQCRSLVARKLLLESESKPEANSLIQAGYGGWLLYTAASAGDVRFVQELLDRDPLLVFGEGEYGVTDILYAVSRSKNSEVFRLLLGKYLLNSHGDFDSNEAPSAFKWEMMNRALNAAARGGNLEMLKELLEDCTDVLAYRDVHGFTILHSASGRGQIEIVKYLVATYEIITCTDINGTTALHVAAFYGQAAVLEALIRSTPSSVSLRNSSGGTFLHMAVAGFQVPDFRRLDQHIELIKHLACGKTVDLHDIINVRNNDGKTALHNAVAGIIDATLVEVLMSVPSIDLNIYDADGLTPLDVLSQQPHTLTTDILIKDLISAGGIRNCQDGKAKRTIVSPKKMQGIGSSPGTCFGIPDAKILSYMESDALGSSVRLSPCSSDSINSNNNSDSKKRSSVIHTRRHLKSLFRWSRQWNKLSDSFVNEDGEESAEQNNRENNFSTEPTQDTIQAIPQMDSPSASPSTSFSRRSMCSAISFDKKRVVQCRHETGDQLSSSPSFGDKKADMTRKSASTSKRLMDQYFCFGAEDVVIVDRKTARSQQHQIRTLAIPSVG